MEESDEAFGGISHFFKVDTSCRLRISNEEEYYKPNLEQQLDTNNIRAL